MKADELNTDRLSLLLQESLIVDILKYSKDFGSCARYITEQIREIIAARIVALAEREVDGMWTITGLCPERRRSFFDNPTAISFLDRASTDTKSRLVTPSDTGEGTFLSALDLGPSFVIPLLDDTEILGFLLILDMMDTSNSAQILDGLASLSPLLALVLRNAILYRTMESQVEKKTRDLAKSEEEYRLLFTKAGDPIAYHDANGSILRANESFIKTFGYSEAELVSLDTSVIFSAKLPTFDELGSEGDLLYEATGITKGGQHIPFGIRTHALKIGDEPVLMSICRDMAEQKRYERALESRVVALTEPMPENRSINFEELFDIRDIQKMQDELSRAMGVASIITAPDGTAITRPGNFTRLCRDILSGCIGCTHLKEQYSTSGIHLCPATGLWMAGAKIVIGGRHIATWFVGQIRNEAQSERKIREYARELSVDESDAVRAFYEVPVMSNEAFERVVRIIETLTNQLSDMAYQNIQQARFIEERKKAEEVKIARDAAERANKAKSAFISNMSHELRTPLNSVIALSGVLNRRLSGKIEPEEFSYLEIIERNGKHLLALINSILDLSRIEAGKESLVRENFLASTLVREIADLLRPQAMMKGIGLECLHDTTEGKICSDREKCRHIIQNLISNAIKFTEQGCVIIHVKGAPSSIIITVADTGIGISANFLPHVFEEFSQEDASHARKNSGTGLGLAIARKYAELLGGTLTAESEQGKGSTFTLVLPLGVSQG